VRCPWSARGSADTRYALGSVLNHVLTSVRRYRWWRPPACAARLSALSSFYRYCAAHDLIGRVPTDGVARPAVDPDYTATVGLGRALVAAADADTGRLDDLFQGVSPESMNRPVTRRSRFLRYWASCWDN
jgi:hypothetical protein